MKSDKTALAGYEALGLDPEEEVLVIRNNGAVERSQFRISADLKQESQVRRVVTARQTVGSLLARILEQHRATIIKRINQWICTHHATLYRRKLGELLRNLAQELRGIAAQELLYQMTDLARQPIDKDLEQEAIAVINSCLTDALTRFKTKLLEQQIPETVVAIIQSRQQALVTQLRLLKRGKGEDKTYEQDDWLVLPQGTRYIAQRHPATIVVVEQAPQVRTLTFKESFGGRLNSGGNSSFHLAFPYTVFVLIYNAKRLANLYVFYATQPLSSLNVQLYQAELPYVDSNGRVHTCGFSKEETRTLAQGAEKTIGTFWQGHFYARGPRTDSTALFTGTLESLHQWELRTRENERFVLNLPWKKCAGSLSSFIKDRLTEAKSGQRTNSYEDFCLLMNEVTQQVRQEISSLCENIRVEDNSGRIARIEFGKNVRRIRETEITRLREILGPQPQRRSQEIQTLVDTLGTEVLNTLLQAIKGKLTTPEDFDSMVNEVDIDALSRNQKRAAKKKRR